MALSPLTLSLTISRAFNMKFSTALVLLAIVPISWASPTLPQHTDLDRYVQQPDESYRWKVVNTSETVGIRSVVVDMVSQTWLTHDQVDQPEWQHWLVLAIPKQVSSSVGLLYIGGGSNGRQPPEQANDQMKAIARATGLVVAELRMAPNQPLVFHNDGVRRTEDDLIGYTWDQYLETGNSVWLARNPMVKSAVRALDTMAAATARESDGALQLDRFIVAGGSKRGWTTWLTGAVDPRVIGIVPIVIDVLNADISMRHHFAAYGYWAPSIGNYVDHNIMQRMDHPRLADAYALVDPYNYRHRLTMPKLVLNAAGDEFFLPDSSTFYWEDLRGENYLRYVPNGDHGLDGTDALESLIAFVTLLAEQRKPPQINWQLTDEDELLVMTQHSPKAVHVWQAHNHSARDFRVETLGRQYASREIHADADGIYRTRVKAPDSGWTATFMELTFDVGAATPLKLTTEVVVRPDALPFEGKPSHLPPSITLTCKIPSEGNVESTLDELATLTADADYIADKLESKLSMGRLYLNWEPAQGLYHPSSVQMMRLLEQRGFTHCNFQIESGPEITLPPATSATLDTK
ncbi:MAG: PhoPQ-activated protein PqaA family protein [Pseudomonadota bacterium]